MVSMLSSWSAIADKPIAKSTTVILAQPILASCIAVPTETI
jgi:hypothetical protein